MPCETIEEKRGVYIWKGVVFHRSMARVSGDDRCHVCVQFNGEGAASIRRPMRTMPSVAHRLAC